MYNKYITPQITPQLALQQADPRVDQPQLVDTRVVELHPEIFLEFMLCAKIVDFKVVSVLFQVSKWLSELIIENRERIAEHFIIQESITTAGVIYNDRRIIEKLPNGKLHGNYKTTCYHNIYQVKLCDKLIQYQFGQWHGYYKSENITNWGCDIFIRTVDEGYYCRNVCQSFITKTYLNDDDLYSITISTSAADNRHITLKHIDGDQYNMSISDDNNARKWSVVNLQERKIYNESLDNILEWADCFA